MSNLIKTSSLHITHSNYELSNLDIEKYYVDLKNILEQKSHLFIVFLGALIGGILSIFITYQLNITSMLFVFLSILPIGFSYILRKVYINTILKID